MFANILIEYPNKTLDKTFTYSCNNLNIRKGMKVLVPFNNRIVNGFVMEVINNCESDYEIKSIYKIVDENLILNEELLSLGYFLKEKTLCSLISAYQTMLPSSLKIKDNNHNYELFNTYIVLNKEVDYEQYIMDNKRSKKQIELINLILLEHKVLKSEINCSSLKILLENNILLEIKEKKYRINYAKDLININKLTNDQKLVFDSVDFKTNNTYLLYGVTGSGKTEVYLNLINEVINRGKTAIMLVPEISLTAQISKRFYDVFGSKVAIFHSSLSEGEKYDEYKKILNNEVNVVVGTRSAIFVPLNNLGIIIIDEEHSENYKQENNPRYNAIDMASFRSKYNNIPLLLGSATPSLETMARAKKGVYKLLELNKRVNNAVLPDITLVDMSLEMKKKNTILSNLLQDKILEKISKMEQVILLLNRRGYDTLITCKNCGYTYKCPHCDISLTYHKTSNNLRCHYCGYTVLKSDNCKECGEESLTNYGIGTEKLEELLNKLYPQARILRMDTDTTSKKGSHETKINAFLNHEYDILLGTQMISKGFDFPKVTLVGILNADQTLNIPDYKSHERTFELLSQTSGRAGRANLKGEVIIQTFNPNNYALNYVKNNDYNSFYNYEMNIRKKLSYPPYYYLCGIKIVSKDYDECSKESKKVANYLKKNLSDTSIVLGPTIASMFRINNIYRFQIIIKYKKDSKLNNTLIELDKMYVINKKVNLEIDLSPNKI